EFPAIQTAVLAHDKGIKAALKTDIQDPRLLHFLFQNSLDTGHAKEILPYVKDDIFKLWALLLTKQWKEAGAIFEKYPLDQLSSETSPLFPLYGCYLRATKNDASAKAHFSAVLEMP